VKTPTLPHVALPHVTLPHVTLPQVSLPDVSVPRVTVPHVSLPHVDVHDVADRVSDRAGDVGELVSDAWSAGLDRAQQLAAAAFDVIDDIPEKAIALAGAVVPALRPTPKRSRRPLLLIAAVLASVAVVAWFAKKRRSGSAEPYPTPRPAPAAAQVSAAS
jgi:hypothetical protein